jgi:hypothetical protein
MFLPLSSLFNMGYYSFPSSFSPAKNSTLTTSRLAKINLNVRTFSIKSWGFLQVEPESGSAGDCHDL